MKYPLYELFLVYYFVLIWYYIVWWFREFGEFLVFRSWGEVQWRVMERQACKMRCVVTNEYKIAPMQKPEEGTGDREQGTARSKLLPEIM